MKGATRFVKVDAYAIFEFARLHHLSADERWLLVTLTLQADFRSHEWSGTFGELVELTRIGKNRVPAVVARLASVELIAIIVPFGRNQRGALEVVVYDRLVRPEKRPAKGSTFSLNGENAAEAILPALSPDRENPAVDSPCILPAFSVDREIAPVVSSGAARPRGLRTDAFEEEMSGDSHARNSREPFVVSFDVAVGEEIGASGERFAVLKCPTCRYEWRGLIGEICHRDHRQRSRA